MVVKKRRNAIFLERAVAKKHSALSKPLTPKPSARSNLCGAKP
jgi:hypothetical protein